jgi:hypothetical protein
LPHISNEIEVQETPKLCTEANEFYNVYIKLLL